MKKWIQCLRSFLFRGGGGVRKSKSLISLFIRHWTLCGVPNSRTIWFSHPLHQSSCLFTSDYREELDILSDPRRRQRAARLLDILEQKKTECYKIFLEALEDNYPHLYLTLVDFEAPSDGEETIYGSPCKLILLIHVVLMREDQGAMDQTWRFHRHKFIHEKTPKLGRILYRNSAVF